jgi:hypothetical protein
LVKLYVEELNDINSNGTIKRAYQLQNINKIPLESKRFSNNSLASSDQRNNYTISELHALVKQHDKNFKPTEASKVVNEDGTPKVVYHGTDKGGFYVFDPKMSDDKISLFFSDSKVTSNSYTQSDNQQLYEVYLAIKKPYVIDAKGHMWNELDDKLGNTTREIAEKAKSQGYDGVIIENVRDMGAIVINNTTEDFYNDFISTLTGGNKSAVV